MMDELAIAFAEADPATTPRDEPLSPDILELLAQIVMTARAGADAPRNRTDAEAHATRKRLPRLMIGVAVAVSVLAVIVVFTMSQLRGVVEPNMADYPWYGTEAELVDAADAVIVGQVLGERKDVHDGTDYVIVTIEVDAVASGELAPNERIEVKYPASRSIPVGMQPGDRTILFLAIYADAPASLLNPVQASYLVTSTGTIETSSDNPLTLSPDLLEQLGVLG